MVLRILALCCFKNLICTFNITQFRILGKDQLGGVFCQGHWSPPNLDRNKCQTRDMKLN